MKKNAFGHEIKPLCFTPEDDELLALGYPHLARIVEDHKDDAKAGANARKAASTPRGIAKYRLEWPRKVAEEFVRLSTTDWFRDWKMDRPSAEELAVKVAAGPVAEDEARAILAFAVPHHGCSHTGRVEAVDFILEQLVGTEVVVDALVGALERLPKKRFRKEEHGPDRQLAGHVLNVGFMLLRLTEARRAHHRARLEALWEAHHDGSKAWEVMTALDRVLHGAKAFGPRTGHYDYLDWHVFVDDVAHLHDSIAHPETIYADLDVRFVYLAGPEVLGMIGKRRPHAENVIHWLEDIGKIKHPLVTTLFLEYVGKPRAKDAPLRWFKAHAADLRAELEAMAKKTGANAEKAKGLLAAI